MTLQEAMKSGRRFRPIGNSSWLFVDRDGYVCFVEWPEERIIFSTSWLAKYELEPLPEKSVTITASQLDEAFKSVGWFLSKAGYYALHDDLKKELGL